MKWSFRRLSVGSALTLVGVLALAGGVLSLATRHSSEAATKRSAASTRGGPHWLGMRHFGRPSSKDILKRRKQFQSELAKELGVSTEKVEKAFRDLFEKHLNQAVDDGDLTRKQANRILSCYDNPGKCKPPFRNRRGFRGPPGGGPPMGGPGGYGPPGGGPGFGPPM